MQFHCIGSGGLSFFMNCTNVYVNASNLKLLGNDGYFGGNAQFCFMLFTNISVTLEDSILDAGQASRGAGALVIINQDTAVNDKDSCSHRLLHLQNHHQLMHLSNVSFRGNVARMSGADFQIEDPMKLGHWCANQLVVMENCNFSENTVIDSGRGGGGVAARFSSAANLKFVYPSCMKRNLQIQFRNTTFETKKHDSFLFQHDSINFIN